MIGFSGSGQGQGQGGTDGQSPDDIFDALVRQIHAVPQEPGGRKVNDAMDIHRQELQAMFDAYLGSSYDVSKVTRVAEFQEALRTAQWLYAGEFQAGRINGADYATKVNDFAAMTFKACEQVLGHHDFVQLFGEESFEGLLLDPSKM